MHRTLQAVDLRDEAVRVLRRAVEHVEAARLTAALAVIQTEGRNWWDEAQHVPSLVCFGGEGE